MSIVQYQCFIENLADVYGPLHQLCLLFFRNFVSLYAPTHQATDDAHCYHVTVNVQGLLTSALIAQIFVTLARACNFSFHLSCILVSLSLSTTH